MEERTAGCEGHLVPDDETFASHNTRVLVQKIRERRGVKIPRGRFYVNSITPDMFPSVNDTRGFFLTGEGIYQSILRLAKGNTAPMFDFTGPYHFDVTWRDIQFHGGGCEVPCLLRWTFGSRCYRVSFRDVWVKRVKGDGIHIHETQRMLFDGVTLTHCSGWGMKLSGALGVQATCLDIEQCGEGGLYVDNRNMHYRSWPALVLDQFYTERQSQSKPALRLERVSGVQIRGVTYQACLVFGQDVSHCEVHGMGEGKIVCEAGSRHNIGLIGPGVELLDAGVGNQFRTIPQGA